jgi:hypothetical protein
MKIIPKDVSPPAADNTKVANFDLTLLINQIIKVVMETQKVLLDNFNKQSIRNNSWKTKCPGK